MPALPVFWTNTISALNNMDPRIEVAGEQKLIGKRETMSFANNTTGQLWRGFMPHRNEIKNRTSNDLLSVQVYEAIPDFTNFAPNTMFEKWAAAAVTDFTTIPAGMETYTLPGGLYAVFLYKGLSTDDQVFRYIFGTWLPASDYVLDHRPHFEVLGEKYKNNDSESEEEIWIPIKKKE